MRGQPPRSAFTTLISPGQYLRRIKSVSLTIPCVTGPYAGVPCTLTLLRHSVRKSSSSSGNYARDTDNDDSRFVDSFGAIQSIVTSSAQNDSGLFETNLRDDRYLPFEGAGAISGWRIQLPKDFSSRSTTKRFPMSSCMCDTPPGTEAMPWAKKPAMNWPTRSTISSNLQAARVSPGPSACAPGIPDRMEPFS